VCPRLAKGILSWEKEQLGTYGLARRIGTDVKWVLNRLWPAERNVTPRSERRANLARPVMTCTSESCVTEAVGDASQVRATVEANLFIY
jgi:hypothetical protein